ncbi:MAG TPA: iron ABC transporter permease [Fimbriimonadaceae bacterium]|nr:iron ABC transporter permease [Fimbriimonadaceae bacterium]
MAASPSPKAARAITFGLIAITLLAFLLHVGYGSTAMLSPIDVAREILSGPNGATRANDVVWQVRLERGIACLLIGGILGAVGSAFQALFRNPLADPYIVGVSSGAAIGGVLVEMGGLTGFLGGLSQDMAAFAGGILSLGLVMALAGKRGGTNVVTLLLAGVVVGSMLAALLSLAILAAGQDTNHLLRWLMGSTSEARWPSLALLAVALVVGGFLLVRQARALNAFAIGEETARRLGVNTRRLKATVLVTGTAMTAFAVGTAGIIAFLGLVAPHISRGLLGTDWRRSLAGSILVGSGLMLIADALTQRAIPAATQAFGFTPVVDLPVGVVTAIIGAPTLLVVLRRTR